MVGKVRVYKTKKELITDLVKKEDVVLDVGFWGQAIHAQDPIWPHRLLLEQAQEVYGVDLEYDASALEHPERYQKASAEDFYINKQFDAIFAGDLIEHLSNPGKFLVCCRKVLAKDGVLIITTPNAFSLFPVLEKLLHKNEPSTNKHHTMYFNQTVLSTLLEKNGFRVEYVGYVDTFQGKAWKRLPVRWLNNICRYFTPKFLETLVIVAKVS